MAHTTVASDPSRRSSGGTGRRRRRAGGVERRAGGGASCGVVGGGQQPAEERLARQPDARPGSPVATNDVEVGRGGPGCGPRSCRTRSPGRSRPRRRRAATRVVGPLDEEGRAPRRRRRRSVGCQLHRGGSPSMCIATQPTPAAAATSGQRRRHVVHERRAGRRWRPRPSRRGGCRWRPARGGQRRARRAAPGAAPRPASTGSAPGRVDSPPTSMTVAPSATSPGHGRWPRRGRT